MSELLTVRDVAAVLQCSEDAVAKRFSKLPGVIDLGSAETRNKRRYRVLRIPRAVLEKYLSSKAGHPVRVEVPSRPERRRQSPNWKAKAILNLAKAGLQNGCTNRKDKYVYHELAQWAWVLAGTNVPESQWSEIMADWEDRGDWDRFEWVCREKKGVVERDED